MAWLRSIVDRMAGITRERPSSTEREERRLACRNQHHSFQILLAANSRALELMSDVEEVLHGGRVFGMSFVRASCTAMSVSVYNVIKHLDNIAPGKYQQLFSRFDSIQTQITEALAPTRTKMNTDRVVPLEIVDKNLADVVGSKMANLGEITSQIGLPVPAGFVVTVRGFDEFMSQDGLQEEIERLIQATKVEDMSERFALSAQIQQKIMETKLPEKLEHSLFEQFDILNKRLGPNLHISLRSSALGEDAVGTSFAGQFRSLLNVDRDTLADAYREVVASLYGLPALSYRLNRGIRDEDVAMCVGGMAMVDSVAGGVVYSRSPVNVRDRAVIIHAVWGLPKLVVDGKATPDRIEVSRPHPGESVLHIRSRVTAHKTEKYICRKEEGVVLVEQPEEQIDAPALGDDHALQLADMATRLEDYYGTPQDIEWCLDTYGRLYILQCRPLARRDSAEVVPEAATRRYGEPVSTGGQTASPGVGCGPVYRVESDVDALQFPPGSVLVTRLALPKWASLLNWCAAVVTEQGSVTGHFANVAREFGIPVITGHTGALSTLRPRRVVTVDADGCVIYPGCVDDLLQRGKPRPDLMKGSPVYELLRQISKLLLPLNLVDPDSPDFRVRNIRSLHDITRFCHEKAVHEMFESNMNRDQEDCASKRLVDKGEATQFWVVDLEDGFVRPEDGNSVDISNIASVPMLALWEGISAIPWEGPPRVNTRGFMSIVAEATVNPALHPALQSKFANRNYFLVSRDYCNLQSRFGFHFSTVEAVAGDRPQRNYVNFRFAGGAADYDRRCRRARFIGGILEDIDFYVNVRGDTVLARYEGFPKDVMCTQLRVMGYLTMHTRQLDMIMADAEATSIHRKKIMADVEKLLSPQPQ